MSVSQKVSSPMRTNSLIRILLLLVCYWTTSGMFSNARAEARESAGSLLQRDGADTIDFGTEVKPILSDKCYFCHGPDAGERHADLRLDVPPEEQGGISAIVPGSRDESLMWQRINDRDSPMPPVESRKSLTASQIEILGRWIDQGANYEAHWAYAPISRPVPPDIDDNGWGQNDIDRFLYHEMQRHNLSPSPEAYPTQLLRRVCLDLTGLPPTTEIVAAYLADPSDQAYRQVVEKLIDSPRFGEHWAAWWLDLVRYGDSVGFHGDQPISVWPYRDWVIQAFNTGMPFDEFTRLQLAGDLLETDSETKKEIDHRLFASAYNRLGPVTAEGGAQQAEYKTIYAADRVANFGEVWLASSIGCARCHDHKYDPFTSADFYSLAAVFEDIDHPIVSSDKANPHWGPFRFIPQDDEQSALIADVDREYYALLRKYPEAGPYETWRVSRGAGNPPPHDASWSGKVKSFIEKRNALAEKVPYGLITRKLPKPRPVKFLSRGNWLDDSGPIMEPRAPEFLGGFAKTGQKFNRLDLANWLFEPDNSLPARVVVNRLWAKFFGRGISTNTLDFGNQGDPPTHRQLLDHLAVKFREEGWDIRRVMKAIVLSRAYRQSSNQDPPLVRVDPENKWFARQSRSRLSAEILRDQVLAVSGLLTNKLRGPSVFPYQPSGHWNSLNFPKRKYPQSSGSDLYRRSIYTWVQRTFPHPAMTVFDAPNRESCTAMRPESNTPLQSLALLNEPLNVEAARNLAQRTMQAESGQHARFEAMFLSVLQRQPFVFEEERIQELFSSQRTYFESYPDRAEALCRVGDSRVNQSLQYTELAAYTAVGRVLLNLHEFVSKP